jgi:hypothetical protein
MKKPSSDYYIVIGFILLVVVSAIPFRQVIDVTKVVEYNSTDQYYIQASFGGPDVTWVSVTCNRTSEIRFMHQIGVWVSTRNALLASFRSTTARYNFNSEYSMNIVEVVSDGPFIVRIIYTYLVETEVNLIDRFLFSFRIYK